MSATSLAAGRLRSFIERVERMDEEIRDLNADKSEVYKEAKGEGFDVKTMRKVISARRMDSAEREEADAIFDLYWSALYGSGEASPRVHVHVRTHEDTKSDGGAIAAVTSKAQLADAVGVEPPPSDAIFEPPTFLKKAYVLRPHCQRPDNCGGYGSKHCGSCERAPAEVVDA